MVGPTGTAVLARPDGSIPEGLARPAAGHPAGARTEASVAAGAAAAAAPGVAGAPPGAGPRTAAGARAMRRRRARLAADRRPPSGVLPSGPRRSAVVAADRGDEVDHRSEPVGRWVRLACTLCFAATAVLVAVVLLSSGSAQVIGSVVVQPGDTLWSVAQHADPGADPRVVVERIKELNGLPGDAVLVGAVLQVPLSTQ